MSRERCTINVIGKAGTGKSSLVAQLAGRFDFHVYRPSDTIRTYARAHAIPLKSRGDYVDAHRMMLGEDPDSIVRPVITSTARRICIDGMRVPAHVRAVQRAIGLHTLRLWAPPERDAERFQRTLASTRQGRDDSTIQTLEAFLADEAVDDGNIDSNEPNVSLIEAMADHSIDAFLPQAEVFAQAEAYVGRLLVASQTP